jgi:hypothetical protein
MIKGVFLAIFASIFLVSLIFIISNLTGNLQENLVTGAIIGQGKIISYSIISLTLSLIASLGVILSMRG